MIDRDKVRRALEFYECAPDGQYDLDVVVPVLREWLAAHDCKHEHTSIPAGGSSRQCNQCGMTGLPL